MPAPTPIQEADPPGAAEVNSRSPIWRVVPRTAAQEFAPPMWRSELEGWPSLDWPAEPIRPPDPSPRSVLHVRLLVILGLAALGLFFVWLFHPDRRGDAWLFWPLAIGLGYRGLWWTVEWWNYVRPKFEPHREARRAWTADVFTTACPGEPRGMILRTLLAMQAIRYPHTSWLCDEGDDPVLRAACAELGIVHVTREVKKDAKAGNINNALTQSTGEIAVVLDPDHEPSPYLLDRVLGHFEDPGVGFVQSVQAYRNQKDGFVADGAAKQTYLFYGPLMIGMNAYGTTQAIGANCVFRRSALSSIGGHAAGLAEDMHTSMQLYAKGWRSVYVPEVLTRGLVPSTLAAYCSQQLKWACGSLDLLLRVYPKLCGDLTVWQRVHYFLGPLYFLRGFAGLINILVPIACLVLGGVALRIDLVGYLTMFLPVMLIAGVIRQLTQHWVIEERERGAHLIGGILATGCWWVFLQGVICSLLGRKLPYIPTPKDNDVVDCWRLAMPNLAAAALSVAAVGYGLWMDWTPFNLFMAAFALWNAVQLSFVALLGQQRTLRRCAWFFVQRDWAGRAFGWIETTRFFVHGAVIRLMRERAVAVAAVVIVTALAVQFRPRTKVTPDFDPDRFKETGGFYAGVDSSKAGGPADYAAVRTLLGTHPRLLPLEQKWGPNSLAQFPRIAMAQARQRGAVPLITWTPWTSTFPELADDPDLARDRRVFAAITRGVFDSYLFLYAAKVREFGDPVLIRFAPQPDNPVNPWSATGGNTPAEFVAAWTYVVSVFQKAGASNVGWVWNPSTPKGAAEYFPGLSFVDWIGLPALNKGTQGGGRWREFSEIYRPLRAATVAHKLPVLLTDFGTVEGGGGRPAWLAHAFSSIAKDFPEIRGVVLPSQRGGWFDDPFPATAKAVAGGLALPHFKKKPARPAAPPIPLWSDKPRVAYRSPFIKGAPGEYQLQVDGKPFYVRGVAYNPGHDWRDGNLPLTRRELLADFTRIHALGANTIRRYGSGWYDRNLFRAAHEQDLKVLYGFWFEHHIDYLADARKRAAYIAEVEATVRARRDAPGLLAWSLGNEVWGLLKHHYAQPYLTEVRHAHIDFIEDLAQRVHAIDPRHPVFVAHEHSPHLAGTLADFARGAPSIDFTGVNSYYEARISGLHDLAAQWDPARPYLVSEFGSDGYWDSQHTRRTAEGALIEASSEEKARLYAQGWSEHTAGHQGANIGGVAYCWRDRFEATATWFGLTDSRGMPKPAYFALAQLWTGRAPIAGPRITSLQGPGSALLPGATIEVNARVTGKNPTLRWQLASDDFDLDVGRLKTLRGGTAVRVTLPREPGSYRLYLNASNAEAADEANVPLLVRAAPGSPAPEVAPPTIARQ